MVALLGIDMRWSVVSSSLSSLPSDSAKLAPPPWFSLRFFRRSGLRTSLKSANIIMSSATRTSEVSTI